MRRFFHCNPEVSMQETHTTAAIAEELKKMGIPFRLTKPTGLVAEICGQTGGGTVALRADMDALPIQEENEVPYSKLDYLFREYKHLSNMERTAGTLLRCALYRRKMDNF